MDTPPLSSMHDHIPAAGHRGRLEVNTAARDLLHTVIYPSGERSKFNDLDGIERLVQRTLLS